MCVGYLDINIDYLVYKNSVVHYKAYGRFLLEQLPNQ